MRIATIERADQIQKLIAKIQPAGAFKLVLQDDVSKSIDTIREAINLGKIDAVFSIFNGRRDEFWLVTKDNLATDGIGMPIAILAPGTRVTINENGIA